jgi:hypothetical protein
MSTSSQEVAMERKLKPLDISALPDLLRLVDVIVEADEPLVLRRRGEDVAVLTPVVHRGHPGTRRPAIDDAEAERAFLATAGSWKGLVDAEQLKARIRAERGSDRPAPEL